jgi:hypothetical protein
MSATHTDPQDADPQAGAGATIPHLTELLDGAQQTARDILEAEEALRLLRQRFEATEDEQARAELAAEALDHVDRQLELAGGAAPGTGWRRRHALVQAQPPRAVPQAVPHSHARNRLVARPSQGAAAVIQASYRWQL